MTKRTKGPRNEEERQDYYFLKSLTKIIGSSINYNHLMHVWLDMCRIFLSPYNTNMVQDSMNTLTIIAIEVDEHMEYHNGSLKYFEKDDLEEIEPVETITLQLNKLMYQDV